MILRTNEKLKLHRVWSIIFAINFYKNAKTIKIHQILTSFIYNYNIMDYSSVASQIITILFLATQCLSELLGDSLVALICVTFHNMTTSWDTGNINQIFCFFPLCCHTSKKKLYPGVLPKFANACNATTWRAYQDERIKLMEVTYHNQIIKFLWY